MITGYVVGKDELIARLSGAPGKLQGSLLKAMTGLGIDLAGLIKENYLSGQSVRAVTGTGRRSTRSLGVQQSEKEMTVTVRTGGPEAPYMAYINKGTAPHEIVPKNKKALAFQWQGRQVVVKSVQHPGIKARHFMQDALAEFSPTIKERLEEAVRDTLEGL